MAATRWKKLNTLNFRKSTKACILWRKMSTCSSEKKTSQQTTTMGDCECVRFAHDFFWYWSIKLSLAWIPIDCEILAMWLNITTNNGMEIIMGFQWFRFRQLSLNSIDHWYVNIMNVFSHTIAVNLWFSLICRFCICRKILEKKC